MAWRAHARVVPRLSSAKVQPLPSQIATSKDSTANEWMTVFQPDYSAAAHSPFRVLPHIPTDTIRHTLLLLRGQPTRSTVGCLGAGFFSCYWSSRTGPVRDGRTGAEPIFAPLCAPPGTLPTSAISRLRRDPRALPPHTGGTRCRPYLRP